MNILFVWTGLADYMGDCWRRLAVRDGVSLKVIVALERRKVGLVGFHANNVLRDLDAACVDDDGDVPELGSWRPDIIFAVGWHSKICRAFVKDEKWNGIAKVCCFDMPWRWALRCIVAPVVLHRFLRRYKAAFVPGSACERYAGWLGFRKTYKGLFGIDTGRFNTNDVRKGTGFFLYIGRNSDEKRLDVLCEAHNKYKSYGGKRELRLYGKGLPGGFANPTDVPGLMHEAAAFVLSSDFDPWPLVLLEAMSSRCPVIASDRCTNRSELGKNWIVFRHGDVEGLAQAMKQFDTASCDPAFDLKLSEGQELAQKYDVSAWSDRVIGICKELVDVR